MVEVWKQVCYAALLSHQAILRLYKGIQRA